MEKHLTRVVNGRERYYIISIYQTLFGEVCLERIYGSTKNKKPTGSIRSFFSALQDAKELYSQILQNKTHKGYKIS